MKQTSSSCALSILLFTNFFSGHGTIPYFGVLIHCRRTIMTSREAVKITTIETVEHVQPSQWPPGTTFLKAFDGVIRDPTYWQSCARWALLKKYGYLDNKNHVSPDDKNFVEKVSRAWALAANQASKNSDDLAEFLRSGTSNHRKLQFSILDCAPGCQVRKFMNVLS